MLDEHKLKSDLEVLFPKNKAAVEKFYDILSRFEKELNEQARDGISLSLELHTSNIDSIETVEMEVMINADAVGDNPQKRLYYVAEAYDTSISAKEKYEVLMGAASDMINSFNLMAVFNVEIE